MVCPTGLTGVFDARGNPIPARTEGLLFVNPMSFSMAFSEPLWHRCIGLIQPGTASFESVNGFRNSGK